MQTLQNPIVAVALAGLVFFGLQKLYALYKAAKAEKIEANRVLVDAVAKLAVSNQALAVSNQVFADGVINLNATVSGLQKAASDASVGPEKILAGVLKACEAIASETSKHRASVAEFTKLVIGPGSSRDALESPTDADRDRVYQEMQYKAAGKSAEEAAALAELDEARAASAYPSE